MYKKTLKQYCLNKTIDACLQILGNQKATERQKNIALRLLNGAYRKSGANIQINSFGEVSHG